MSATTDFISSIWYDSLFAFFKTPDHCWGEINNRYIDIGEHLSAMDGIRTSSSTYDEDLTTWWKERTNECCFLG
jgi:hypothetical protein